MGQGSSTRKNTQYRSGYDEERNESKRSVRWNVGSKPLNRETAVGKAGRKRFNNYTRRYGATRRTQQPPLQQIVIGHTRKNRDDILRILDKHPNDYVKDPQRLLKNLLQTFSIDVDVHIPVELFQRINDIPALVSRLRWEPEFSATLEKIRDTNATLKLLLLPPNERTAYRERLRQEINRIITKPPNRNAIYNNTGSVLKIDKNVLKDTFGLIAAIKEGVFNNVPNRIINIILNKYSDPINSLLLDAILSNRILLENVRGDNDAKEALREILTKHARYPKIVRKINEILLETQLQSSVSATSLGIQPQSATSLEVQSSVRVPSTVGNAPPPSVIEIISDAPQTASAPRPRSNSLRLEFPESIHTSPPPPKKPWYKFWGGTRRRRFRRKQKTMKR